MKPLIATTLLPVMLSAPLLTAAPASKHDSKPAPPRPNILLIVLDDWNWQHSGAYGCDWVKTPNIDRAAREGARFEYCFTSTPKCSPSRASMLTGRNIWQLEEGANHCGDFPKKFAVYTDLLERAGYAIGLTGKGWSPGDFKSAGFTRNPAGPSFDKYTCDRPTTGISNNDYTRNFDAFLKQRPADKPFCFWMGIREPHRPYEQDSGKRLGKDLGQVRVPSYLPDVDIVRGDLADYAAEVEYVDTHIGRMLDLLEAAGELDRTAVVITSDNGMPFPYVKGQIHDDAYRLPLIIRWPGVVHPGFVVKEFANVRDIAPTFLEMAGLPAHTQMTGRSLLNSLRGLPSRTDNPSLNTMLVGKERHDIGRPHDWGYPVRGIRTQEYLYVRNYFPERWPAGNPETEYPNTDNSPTKRLLLTMGGYYFDLSFGKRPIDELYRIEGDPGCVINLAQDPAYETIKQDLRTEMLRQLRLEQDPRALGNGAIFDTYPYKGPRRTGYDDWLKKNASAAPSSN